MSVNSIYSITNIFNESKRSLRLSLPLIGAQLIYAISGFFATLIVAHLGRDELAANALVWSVFTFLIVTFIGVLCSISILVAQSYGAKDYPGIKIVTGQGFILALVLSVPMMLVLWYAPYILIFTKQSPVIIQFATPYFHALTLCVIPLNFLIAVEQFLSGMEKSRLVLIISIAEVPIEIFLFYALVFGKFGFPRTGIIGIAYGAALAMLIADIVVFIYLYYSREFKTYVTNNWCFQKKYFWELIRVGTPMGAMFGIEVALIAVIAFMMGAVNNDTLAAYQIAYQCFMLVLAVIFGLTQGATIRVGYEVGKNNKNAVKIAAYTNLGIGFVYMLFVAIIYFIIPEKIIALYIDIHDVKLHQVFLLAQTFLVVVAILQIADCFRLSGAAALRGLKDTKIPMYISAVTFWLVALPGAYILGFIYKLGGVGIWIGLAIGLATAAVIIQLRFVQLIKKIDLKKVLL